MARPADRRDTPTRKIQSIIILGLLRFYSDFCTIYQSMEDSNSKKWRARIWMWVVCAAAMWHGLGCASSGTLTGGSKDTAPPVLDTVRSPVPRQTNYRPRELTFYFDEFVEVRDPIKQVLVSPPLTYIPRVQQRGKKVTFAFDDKEVLRDNATYTINFGEAIIDYHEGNKLQNFSFVFGTGPYIDSLNIRGRVADAKTGEGEAEMVVLLYDNLADSAIYLEKPFYFAKPQKSGDFTFYNIKNDTFRIVAIKDENLNYRYDPATEKLAFLDTLIVLDASFDKAVELTASQPVTALAVQAANSRTYGKINVQCTATPGDVVEFSFSEADIEGFAEISGDSVNVYYDTPRDSFFMYMLGDTIKVKPKGKAELLRKNKLKRNFTASSVPVLPGDSLVVAFNFPLAPLSAGSVILSDTIGALDDVDISLSRDHKKVIARYDWLPGETYDLRIDSGAVKSIYGQANDSIGQTFAILTADKTAALRIIMSELDTGSTYIVHVLRNNVRIASQTTVGSDTLTINIKGLVPDKYDVEVIGDKNGNGKWDPGNYSTKTQPEPYRFFKGDRLRENRETEMSLSLKVTPPKQGGEPKNPLQGLQNQNKGRQ